MKLEDIIIRCYAEQVDGIWIAVCVDLCLAAQGDSFEKARQKLSEQINEYMYDILEGDDKEYFGDLIKRKAPFLQWIKYYFIKMVCDLICYKIGTAYFAKPMEAI